jgi:hypothetical protein
VAARRATSENPHSDFLEEAWYHVLVCEGSDWFWWFGEHHHTQLDAQWDLNFRRHLQEAYRLLGEPIPHELFVPLLSAVSTSEVDLPVSNVSPVMDGMIGPTSDEWANAGVLRPAGLSTMQRADDSIVREIRFGWDADNLYLLLVPSSPRLLPGLELEIHFLGTETAAGLPQLELEPEPAPWDSQTPARVPTETGESELALLRAILANQLIPETEPRVEVTCVQHPVLAASFRSSWREVIEMALPLESLPLASLDALRLRIGVGREGVVQELLPTRGSLPLGSLRT